MTAVLAQEGMESAVNGSRALAEFQRKEIAKWQGVIRHLRETGVVLE